MKICNKVNALAVIAKKIYIYSVNKKVLLNEIGIGTFPI